MSEIQHLAQCFMTNRSTKEAELRAVYTLPPAKMVELILPNQSVQFQLAAQLSEQNYRTCAHNRIALPVEAGQVDIASFPWIDEDALLRARLICDGQLVTLLRVVYDKLSDDQAGPAHGFVLLEGETGTLNLSIMRVDDDPSNFLVTAATWYCQFPLFEKKSYL